MMGVYEKKAKNKYLHYYMGELPDKQVFKMHKKAINKRRRLLLKRGLYDTI